jgi:UDP-N-acetylglucosamine--N-acetylmuramyl-(pentapeptide) pyrophosphoryl-undecaprenol N-acetylglucosamine transferase
MTLAKRIIIAGGGTGGHIFPALAIAGALKKARPETEILFVGAKGKMEMEKIPQAGYRIEGIDIAGFNRSSLIKNVGLPFKLLKSFFQVRRIIHDFKPDAVVGVGGYSSFPVLRYAQAKGIASFIHEPNSFPGKANILLAKRATKIFVASDGMENFFPKQKIVLSGNPVRKSIVNLTVGKEDALKFFALDPHQQTILVIGGSLGAKSINEAIAANLDQFQANDLQLIWQTGKATAATFREKTTGRSGIWIGEFISEMDKAFAAADIVVSRSGSTLYELCVVKKPVIFVPYPHATEDHQRANAERLVNKNAALMVSDAEVLQKLAPLIVSLSKDEAKQEELKANIGKMAITNADEVIANEILNLVHD